MVGGVCMRLVSALSHLDEDVDVIGDLQSDHFDLVLLTQKWTHLC